MRISDWSSDVCSSDLPIGPQEDGSKIPFIAEHSHPVALGNDQKPDCLLGEPCADLKTNGTRATTYGSDAQAMAKDKRLRSLTKQGPKKAIPSRPFPKAPAGFEHFRKKEPREGYSTAWPSRALPGRPMSRGARNG